MAQGELLLLLAIHLVLTGLPGVAAALYLASRGERREPVLLASFLAASGAAAMLVFWAFYGSHELGQTASFLVAFGSLALGGWSLYEGRIERDLLRRLAVPLGLWALGSAFLVYLGFLHGGSGEAVGMSSTRFSGPLPSDNDIPHFFSDWFYFHGHHGTPPIFPGEWLASDRPPLQIAYSNYERTFGWDNIGLHYQVMGVVLQQLWIVGLWALLVAGRAGRVTRGLAMLTVLLSDIAIVNGFFVWPKLLPAAMLLGAAALVITPLWSEVRRSLWGAALLAALLGLGLLGHGASVFGVIPLVIIALARGLPNWRWIGIGILVGALFMAPWSAYQRWGDPPGNRLTKWFLGGDIAVDKRSTGEAIVDGYRQAGFGGTLHDKGQNFVQIFGGGPMATNVKQVFEAGDFEAAIRPIRSILFYYLLPSLGLLLAGPVAMAIGYRRRGRDPDEWGLALWCLAVFGIGAVAWGLIMFGGSAAQSVIHQGSYLLPVIGIAGSAVGLRATFPRFAIWWLGLNAVLMLVVYAPAFDPPEGSSYSFASGLIAAAALAAFCVVSLRPGRGAGAAAGLAEGHPAAAIDSPA
jgi:hypothetical protein